MIIDHIEHRGFYADLGKGIPRALDYLATTNFANLRDGKHDIDGDQMFALVQRYLVKPVFQARWEFHKRYIDLQYMVAGSERIGYLPWSEGLELDEAYNPQRDLGFYHANGPLLTLSSKMFILLTPHELHAPSLAVEQPEEGPAVFKVVVKIRWEE